MNKPLGPPPDRKEFAKNISKCVLHLLVVQTLQDVLSTGPDDIVYKSMPDNHLLKLLDCLEGSYKLANVFNESMELRQALFKMGYMKQLPNLLKQETLAVNAYLILLIKIYADESNRPDLYPIAATRLIPYSKLT